MRIALEAWSNDYRTTLETCLRAEQLGFDAFYYGESPHGLNLDCWTALAALAQATSTIRIGPVITNIVPQYRSLALLGKQAATVANVSNGRLDFRTGAGAGRRAGREWWGQVGVDYGPYEERLDLLSDALATLPAYWQNRPVTFGAGEPTQLGFTCPPVPITVAARSQRALRASMLAATFYETSFCTPQEFVVFASAVSELHQQSTETQPLLSLEIDGFVGSTTEAAASTVARAMHERHGEDLERVFARALVGDPGQVAQRLSELRSAGVAQVVVALHDPHDPDATEALALARQRMSDTPT